MVISEKKNPQHLATLEQLFSQKILCMSYTGFFWVPIWCFFFSLPSGESSGPKKNAGVIGSKLEMVNIPI
jgi:hypothetical protein